MLINRSVDGNLIFSTYQSSNILSSIYNSDSKYLKIIFTNGGVYGYEQVSPTDFTRFELADSQGAVFNKVIKKYSATKLDAMSVDVIKRDVAIKKKADIKLIVSDFIIDVNSVLSSCGADCDESVVNSINKLTISYLDVLKKFQSVD